MRPVLLSILVVLEACGGATTSRSAAITDASIDAPALDVWSSLPYVGTVQLIRDSSGQTPFYGFTAYFVATPPGGAFCAAGDVHGDCCVTPAAAAPLARVGAGAMLLRDVTTGESSSIQWLTSSNDYDAPSPAITWKPNDELEIAAAGDVVGAFSVKAVAPAEIEGLSPNPQGDLVISTSSDFVVAWAPAQATTMDVTVAGENASVVCRGADAAGSLTVPKAMFAAFSAGTSGFVVATRSGAALGHAVNADVSFEIQTGAASPASFAP